jgi:hypothetical protein
MPLPLHAWPRRAEEKATKGKMRSHRMIGEFTPACARARKLRRGGRKLPWSASASTPRIGPQEAGAGRSKWPKNVWNPSVERGEFHNGFNDVARVVASLLAMTP